MRDWEADIAWYLLGAFVITAFAIVVTRYGHVVLL